MLGVPGIKLRRTDTTLDLSSREPRSDGSKIGKGQAPGQRFFQSGADARERWLLIDDVNWSLSRANQLAPLFSLSGPNRVPGNKNFALKCASQFDSQVVVISAN